jgi:hypothetical protein
MGNHRSRRPLGAVSLAIAAVAIALVAPTSALAATIVVNTIPGAGWIQSPDNTAGGTAAIAAGPAGGLGTSSVHLTTAATSDFAGIARPLVGSLADLTGGSWMTFSTGDTGAPASEAASLRFAIFRTGTTEFTTMTVELSNNGGATAGVWQTNTLTDASMVWQTNATGAFCLIASPCTLAAFKAQYPAANFIGLTVATGSGLPPVTTFVDGVSVTVDGATDTWNFELAAAPTPRPTPRPTSGGGAVPTQPPTSTLEPTAPGPNSGLPSVVVAVVMVTGLLGWAAAWRTRTRRPIPEHTDKPRR